MQCRLALVRQRQECAVELEEPSSTGADKGMTMQVVNSDKGPWVMIAANKGRRSEDGHPLTMLSKGEEELFDLFKALAKIGRACGNGPVGAIC